MLSIEKTARITDRKGHFIGSDVYILRIGTRTNERISENETGVNTEEGTTHSSYEERVSVTSRRIYRQSRELDKAIGS